MIIPYEQQEDLSAGRRMCGAAALRMVYRSLGGEWTQAEIWENLLRLAPTGIRRGRSYLLAGDALSRGYQALVLQASEPERILRHGQELGCRMILNHRIKITSGVGHYSVLVSVSDTEVILHDPQLGPSRALVLRDFLELWRPAHFGSEITGHVLVAVAAERQTPGPCRVCGTTAPATVVCHRCKQAIALEPAAVLGCVSASCPGRLWRRVFCSACDAGLSEIPGMVRQEPAAS